MILVTLAYMGGGGGRWWTYARTVDDVMAAIDPKFLASKMLRARGASLINNYWIRFSHDSDNYQGQSLYYLPKPKAEGNNTN